MQDNGVSKRWNVVVTGGEAPPRRVVKSLIDNAELVIAADSGVDTCLSWEVEPDLIVGDMDSVANVSVLERFSHDRVIKASREKDETDTELAVRYSVERYSEPVAIVGGGGGRVDHLLGIFSLFHRAQAPFSWITDRDEITRVDGLFRCDLPIGTTVSFFPVGRTSARMRSKGLKWKLDGLEWSSGDAGLSNVVTQRPFTVEMMSGRLVCIHSHRTVAQGAGDEQ